MATGGPERTLERENYLRLFCLCNVVARRALTSVFDDLHPNLPGDLAAEKATLMKELRKSEVETLYPPTGNPNSTDFDISLLSSLLRNMNNKASQDQQAKIDLIKSYRNKLFHSADGKIQVTEFNKMWKDLELAIIGLTQNKYKTVIFAVRKMVICVSLEEKLKAIETAPIEELNVGKAALKERIAEVYEMIVKRKQMVFDKERQEIKQKIELDFKASRPEIKQKLEWAFPASSQDIVQFKKEAFPELKDVLKRIPNVQSTGKAFRPSALFLYSQQNEESVAKLKDMLGTEKRETTDEDDFQAIICVLGDGKHEYLDTEDEELLLLLYTIYRDKMDNVIFIIHTHPNFHEEFGELSKYIIATTGIEKTYNDVLHRLFTYKELTEAKIRLSLLMEQQMIDHLKNQLTEKTELTIKYLKDVDFRYHQLRMVSRR